MTLGGGAGEEKEGTGGIRINHGKTVSGGVKEAAQQMFGQFELKEKEELQTARK